VLAPHLWLAPGVSLYDEFGTWFTLLDTRGDGAVREAFEQAAGALGVPLKTLTVETAEARRLYSNQTVLVRPDQHIAWHGTTIDRATAEQVLRIAIGRASIAQPLQREDESQVVGA
jgi:hypothetical protein